MKIKYINILKLKPYIECFFHDKKCENCYWDKFKSIKNCKIKYKTDEVIDKLLKYDNFLKLIDRFEFGYSNAEYHKISIEIYKKLNNEVI
jgi:hypothetical protein